MHFWQHTVFANSAWKKKKKKKEKESDFCDKWSLHELKSWKSLRESNW